MPATEPHALAADVVGALNGGYLDHLKAARMLERGAKTLSFPRGHASISILSSFTIDPLVPCLRARAAAHGIDAGIHQAPYGQARRLVLDPASELDGKDLDLTVLWMDASSVVPELFDRPYMLSGAQRADAAKRGAAELCSILEALRNRVSGTVVVASLVAPRRTEMGVLEGMQPEGVVACIAQANSTLVACASGLSATYVLDVEALVRDVGWDSAHDAKMLNYADMRFSPDFMVNAANAMLGFLLPTIGAVRKCIVVDLDNTLWGGVVGEDGWDGVEIGSDTPRGRAHLALQRALRRFHDRGVLLAVNSKNNLDDALEVFDRREEMILRTEHFAAVRINWQDKAANLREISAELNIGTDSLAFLDDSPYERELVRQALPEVLVPELPATSDTYSECLEGLVELTTLSLTEEDRGRTRMYSEQSAREAARCEVSDLGAYLHSLETEVEIASPGPQHVSRLAQLTQKTNQFNLTTGRYTESDIERFIASSSTVVRYMRVSDRFGDLGVVGLAIAVAIDEIHWRLDTFLMSCRCIGREVEDALLFETMQGLRDRGARTLRIEYLPTAKNILAAQFVQRLFGEAALPEIQVVLDQTAVEVPAWVSVARTAA